MLAVQRVELLYLLDTITKRSPIRLLTINYSQKMAKRIFKTTRGSKRRARTIAQVEVSKSSSAQDC